MLDFLFVLLGWYSELHQFIVLKIALSINNFLGIYFVPGLPTKFEP